MGNKQKNKESNSEDLPSDQDDNHQQPQSLPQNTIKIQVKEKNPNKQEKQKVVVNLNDNHENQEQDDEVLSDSSQIQEEGKQNENPEQETKIKKGVLTKVGEGIKQGAGYIGGGIKTGAEKIGGGIKAGVQKIGQGAKYVGKKAYIYGPKQVQEITSKAAETVKKEVKVKMTNLKNQINEGINEPIKKFMEAKKEELKRWTILKSEQTVLSLLEKAQPGIKELLTDEHMCNFLQDIVDDVVDEVWPEIQQVIIYQLRIQLLKPKIPKPKPVEAPCCICIPWYKLRAWMLYTQEPYNRTIWRQMIDCSWWIIMLIKLIPFYAVQPVMYLLLFLMIDKTDEYQLVNFILKYKKMQFFTYGVVQIIFGYTLFYKCTALAKEDHEKAGCVYEGPGAFIKNYIEFLGFFVQVLLIWIVFLLFPFTKSKGLPKYRYIKEGKETINEKEAKLKELKCCCCIFDIRRGGRLKCFMCYDLFISIICAIGFLVFVWGFHAEEEYKIKESIYYFKSIYGLLSFPFLIFNIPLIDLILTKSRPTGYTRGGACIPKIQTLKFSEDRKQDGLASLVLEDGMLTDLFKVPENFDEEDDEDDEEEKLQLLNNDEIELEIESK